MSQNPVPTILITGATGGIGYATARRCLAAGAHVLLHGPSLPEAERAAEHLVAGGADATGVTALGADFARLDEVTALASAVSTDYIGLDAVIHSAALVAPAARQLTVDGNELTFQVNYLAPVLLTRLLLAPLRAAEGRVVAVSSVLHCTGNLNWGDPQRTRFYAPVPAYAQSKLALTMFVRALADQHPGIGAVSVHPGIVDGGLLPVYSRVGASVDEAAEVLCQLAAHGTEIANGAYYDGLTPATAAPLADNPEAVRRLWKLTTRILGQSRFALPRAA